MSKTIDIKKVDSNFVNNEVQENIEVEAKEVKNVEDEQK